MLGKPQTHLEVKELPFFSLESAQNQFSFNSEIALTFHYRSKEAVYP